MIVFLAGLLGVLAATDLSSALEGYLWGKERMAGFLQGSKEYYHYELLTLMNQGRVNSSEFDSLMTRYQDFGKTDDYKTLHLRSLLKKWDTPLSSNERTTVLRDISSYLERHYSGAQPTKTSDYDDLPSKLPYFYAGIPQYVYTSLDDFDKLTPAAYPLLVTYDMSKEVLLRLLTKDAVPEIGNLPSVLATKVVFEEIESYLTKMTVEQLEEYGELRPDARVRCTFADAILRKKHPLLEETYEKNQRELRDALNDIKTDSYCKAIEKEVLYRLLTLGLYTHNLSESEFQRYLTLNKELNGKISDFEYIRGIDEVVPSLSEEVVLREYEEYYLGREDPEFSHYLTWYPNKAVFREKVARAALLSGQVCSDSSLPGRFITAIASSQELEFDRNNPLRFSVKDGITLKIRRKNIDKLTFKVISIDAERYYRTNRTPIPTDLLLDGVEATLERVLDTPRDPLMRVTETVAFPEFAGKEGLYAVEVMGGGLHARAWVQKGGLQRITLYTEEGYKVYIYSTDGELMKSEHTGLLINEKLYLQQPEADFVLVPWATEIVNKTLVLLSGNLAQYLGEVKFDPPQYELKAGYHIETEALRPKQRGFVVVTPQLYLHGHIWPLSSLRSIHAKASVIGEDDREIVVSETVHELSSGSFSVPLDLPEEFSSLEITLSAALKSQPDKLLSTSKKVDINLNYYQIADLYLRKTFEEYQIHIFGKNGEGLSGVAVDITLTSIYYKEGRLFKLSSDDKGIIYLGSLENVETLEAKMGSSRRSWKIDALREQVSYPGRISMRSSDSIQIPVVGLGPVSLLTMVGDLVVKRTELSVDQATHTVSLQGMEQGQYQLRLPYASKRISISIRVLTGELLVHNHLHWSEGITSLTQFLPLSISSLEVRQKSIKVQLSGQCQDAYLTIALRQFAGTDVAHWAEFSQLKTDNIDYYYPTSLYAKAKYLGSRLLDEEYLYVMDRKQAKDKRGISLPSPSLLVHPDLVGGTFTDSQYPHKGTEFDDSDTDYTETQDDFEPEEPDDDYWKARSSISFVDFLDEPAIILTNLRVDEDCAATIGISQLRKYAMVEVMAVSNGNVVVRTEAVPNGSMGKRSLVLGNALPAEGGFAEVRSMKVVRKGQERDLVNSKNASTVSINTLGKLLEVLRCYQSGLSEWMFLGDWGLKTLPEKLSLYHKFAGNELNYFLYHKDFSFFSAYVKPLIIGKMDKTVIDDILLERPLDEYLVFPQVSLLSSLEKALLGKHEPRIAALKTQNTANPPSLSFLQKLFDHVFKDLRKNANIEFYLFRRNFGILDFYKPLADRGLWFDDDFKIFTELDYHSDRTPSNEYVEYQYRTQKTNDISPEFWATVGQGNSSQLTESVLFAHNSVREALLAVALVDLPWTSATSLEFGDNGTTDSDYVLLTRAIQNVPIRLSNTLTVVQFYTESTEEAKELVKGKAYTVKIVLCNLSHQSSTVEVLMQIPQGSISLHHRGTILSNTVTIDSYSTRYLTYECYFPAAGEFIHAGAYVVQDGVVIQRSPHSHLQVLEEPSRHDAYSLADIAATRNLTAVLNYLSSNNLESESYYPVLPMLSDEEAFKAITNVLRNRLIYEPEVWAYSLQHQSELEMQEFLSSDSSIRTVVGPHFHSFLVTTKAGFQYREYFPLFNPRWHPLRGHSRIANQNFRTTYESFLKYLAYKSHFDLEDRLILAQYFVMQHRYQEAQHQIDLIADMHANTDLSMQIDYLKAFLNSSIAIDTIERYNTTISPFWKEKWEEMGREVEKKQANLYSEALLSAEVIDTTLAIYSEDLPTCLLKIHKIDLELLFSRSPFLKTTPSASAYTAPSFSDSIALVSGFVVKYKLPEQLQLANLMLSLDCGGQSWSGLYAKSGLKVQVYSSKGLIRVTDVGLEGVPGAYAKVYVKDLAGKIDFYKDGYTDSKGKFDYTSVTSDEKSQIAAFSLLVTHETLGSTVLEIAP